MKPNFKMLCFILFLSRASSSITGITYLDPLIQKPLKPLPGENPCNPLYWYPRQIPEYCYYKVEITPVKQKPVPTSVPMPPPIASMPPIAIPMQYSFPTYSMPIFSSTIPQFVPPPLPQILPPLMPQMPYGPFNPMMPMPMPAPAQYTFQPQAGLVPGVQGMVSQDGGINILPFSDAYSDMLEKHKQKMIRKRLQKVLDDYENYPRKRRH